MTTQPEAHRLADVLDAYHKRSEDKEAAALLRAQHAEIERKDALLRQAFDALRQCEFTVPPAQRPIVKDALAATTKELQ